MYAGAKDSTLSFLEVTSPLRVALIGSAGSQVKAGCWSQKKSRREGKRKNERGSAGKVER